VAIAIHLLGQYPLYLFAVLHVAGALFHGFVQRDGVLERMLPLRGSLSAFVRITEFLTKRLKFLSLPLAKPWCHDACPAPAGIAVSPDSF